MSDIWVPDDPAEAELIMKIEAAKFEKTQVEIETAALSSRLDFVRSMISRVEENVQFLSSRKARIILMLEFRNARRNLAALRAEEKSLLRLLDQQERSQVKLAKEIENLEAEAAKVGKVLRFKKREQREGEGSQD